MFSRKPSDLLIMGREILRARKSHFRLIGVAVGLMLLISVPANGTLISSNAAVGVSPNQSYSPPDSTFSEAGTTNQVNPDCHHPALHKKFGTVIASGKASDSEKKRHELKSYRIEEVKLPSAITCVVDVVVNHQFIREARTFDKFWRISVTGEKVNFPQGLNWYIWFDDVIVGASGPGKNKELVTLIYDPQLLREGATVGVSYGLTGPRETISQTLHFATKP